VIDIIDAEARQGHEEPVTEHEEGGQLDEEERLQDEVDVEVGHEESQQQAKKEAADERIREDPQKFHA
jgi:hypothetical protein